MTEDQATTLGRRIVNTLRPTPALAEWVEALMAVPHAAALSAYTELRGECEHGLSIARFLRAIRERDALASAPPRPIAPRPDCPDCAGAGWVDCTDERRHAAHCIAPDDCHCSAVVRCECRAPARDRARSDRVSASTPELF